MDWYSVVNDYYKTGYYTIDQVKVFVQKGKITAVQFQEITGQEYTA
ncbi:MAG: XkdX family protein [Clostridiales bacterium]|jgi:uncharacterized XkdX family phage protein|nr:XkdX family protein [Eubacteriales bacterium]MDH7566845.1 XkdX family protein [Clostridiales bacterium]